MVSRLPYMRMPCVVLYCHRLNYCQLAWMRCCPFLCSVYQLKKITRKVKIMAKNGYNKSLIMIMIMIRFVMRTYPPCWVLKARIQKHRGKPLLFHDKCPGFFYVHYTTHGTYSFTSHPKDEAIMVKCLAQGHKRRDRPGRDSNPHSGNTRT